MLDEKLITSFPVMTEVCHILLKRQGVAAQLRFMQMYQLGAFDVFEIEDRHKGRIVQLMYQYADLPMDFADASSMGTMKIETLEQTIAAAPAKKTGDHAAVFRMLRE